MAAVRLGPQPQDRWLALARGGRTCVRPPHPVLVLAGGRDASPAQRPASPLTRPAVGLSSMITVIRQFYLRTDYRDHGDRPVRRAARDASSARRPLDG
ncbi:MAG: hypothetical protein ACLQB1_43910, partial [Streptosporangiaceae bacterium]